jgi:surfeit locus 1 family protein
MKLPVIPTAIVAVAVSAMIALGVWQLQRAKWKDAILATYAANAGRAAMAFPQTGPVLDNAMFRKSELTCLRVIEWRRSGGADKDGRPGTRYIADCATGAMGQGALVDIGVGSDPRATPVWKGGSVKGIITTEPDFRSLIGRVFAREMVLRPMLVATNVVPELRPSPPPSPASVPNNHLAYAGQWFLFAASAIIIYILALRRRQSA